MTATGRVKGLKIWSETHISGLGGDGHVSQGNGFSTAISIRSTVKVKREFWVIDGGGQEHRVIYDEGNLSVRDGQTVTLVWGASARQNSGPYIALSNRHYNNGRVYRLSGDHEGVLSQMGLGSKGKPGKIGLLIAVVVVFLLWRMMGAPSLVFDLFGLLIFAGIVTVIGQRMCIRWWDSVFHEAAKSV